MTARMLRRLIISYRKVNKLSLRELAARMGVSLWAVHRLEAGKPISEANWVKIVKWIVGE